MKISYLIICMVVSLSLECQAQNKKDKTQVQQDTVAIITEKAEKGDVNAQYLLAQWYFNGFQSVDKDQQKAIYWWDKAAKQKDVNAIARLAECYQYGYGVSPDSAYAASLYESAISRGNEELMNQLDKRARQGKEIFAAMLLRDVYQKGIRTKTDQNKADEYLKMAAQYGNIQSAFLYGLTQYNKKNKSEALPWFKTAADKGHNVANFMYGLQLFEGDGTPKDVVKGIEYMDRAAKAGNVAANAELGRIFLNGEGTDKDIAKAVNYLKNAAFANKMAAWQLGNCYKDGIGVNKDYEMAAHWMAASFDDGKDTRDRINKLLKDDNGGHFTNYLRGVYKLNIDNDYEKAAAFFKKVEKAKVNGGAVMGAWILANKDYKKYDPKKAVKTLKKYTKTSPQANYFLYEIYANDANLSDKQLADQYLDKAVEMNHPKAIVALADMYMTGIGKNMDTAKAAELYLTAEKMNALTDNAAQNLAKCYEMKLSTITDVDQAEQRIKYLNNYKPSDKLYIMLSKVSMI